MRLAVAALVVVFWLPEGARAETWMQKHQRHTFRQSTCEGDGGYWQSGQCHYGGGGGGLSFGDIVGAGMVMMLLEQQRQAEAQQRQMAVQAREQLLAMAVGEVEAFLEAGRPLPSAAELGAIGRDLLDAAP